MKKIIPLLVIGILTLSNFANAQSEPVSDGEDPKSRTIICPNSGVFCQVTQEDENGKKTTVTSEKGPTDNSVEIIEF